MFMRGAMGSGSALAMKCGYIMANAIISTAMRRMRMTAVDSGDREMPVSYRISKDFQSQYS